MKFLEGVYCSIECMVFRISVTGIPLGYFITFCSRCSMEWDTACRATDDSILRTTFFFPSKRLGNWKIYTLSIHPKKIIIPAPIHSNAFVPLYKFETSWSLFCRLSRGFVAISRASNLRFSWNCSRHGLQTIVRAISSSCLFCI